MYCSHFSFYKCTWSRQDNLQSDVLTSTGLANEHKWLLHNVKQNGLSMPCSTFSYWYIATKEKQYQESSFLHICQRPGLPNLFRFMVTHTQAHTVGKLNDHLTKGTVLPLARLEIVTPQLEHTRTPSHTCRATSTHQVEGNRAAEESILPRSVALHLHCLQGKGQGTTSKGNCTHTVNLQLSV